MTALPRGGRPAEALAAVEATIEDRWRLFLAEYGVAAETSEEIDLAESVVADTSVFEWRVVDAAFDRLTCTDCGTGLGSGPVGCAKCDQANGFRFAAIETDRPATPAGTEHGLRVATAVARARTATARGPAAVSNSVFRFSSTANCQVRLKRRRTGQRSTGSRKKNANS